MFSVQRHYERVVRDSYRAYVTDALNNIPQGKYLTKRWYDIVRQPEEIDADATIDHVAAALEV